MASLEAAQTSSTANDDAARAIAQRFLLGSTAKQRILTSVFRAPDNRFQPICQSLTVDGCEQPGCQAVHFEPVLYAQTDVSLGHCSYLNTCHRTDRCKYLHFRPVVKPSAAKPFVWRTIYDDNPMPVRDEGGQGPQDSRTGNLYGQTTTYDSLDGGAQRSYIEMPILHPCRALRSHNLQRWIRHADVVDDAVQARPAAQWIDADINQLDFSILGKFDIILADPPWDIHMSLPYVTMTDNSMRAMPLPALQDEGFLFLWVTSRAMELGRECMALWGYTRIDEIVWIKVGQTQRLIRTGRTGHWLNHTKEHCLVGVKTKQTHSSSAFVSPLGSLSNTFDASHAPGVPATKLLPTWAHAGLDTDVIVAEVRDTSRKPDELYSIIERLCPNGKKIELFGRRHNARPGWLTVGNQLKGDNILDPDLRRRVESWKQAGSSAAAV